MRPRSLRLTPALFAVALIAALGSLVGCGSGADRNASSDPRAEGGALIVFAAASLSAAFESIGEAFAAAHPTVAVEFIFAASSELVAQIVEGAPADVFASADLISMTRLSEAGVTAGTATVFARNSAEILVAPGNPLGIAGVADLVDPGLILVTCAPEVPCGAYAEDVFENAGIVVTPDSYEENVNGVVNKVVLGEADAGMVYATDVIAAGVDASGVAIAGDLNVVAEYPIVGIEGAANASAASAFVTFVLGVEAQKILTNFGFGSP